MRDLQISHIERAMMGPPPEPSQGGNCDVGPYGGLAGLGCSILKWKDQTDSTRGPVEYVLLFWEGCGMWQTSWRGMNVDDRL